jgi:hypothetical protein
MNLKNRWLFFRAACAISLITFLPASRVQGAEVADLDLDINRIKKEITQVRAERQRLKDDIARDKSDFDAYCARTASRKKAYVAETDSVRGLIVSFGRKKDSLDAHIAGIEQKKRNFDLLKENFREHIARACGKLIDYVKRLPPALSRPAAGALTFLLNDCKTRNIDNVEALQRLVQIVRNLDESTLSIQTGQEASPAPSIRGSAAMLRIGSIFEAVVDEDGKNGAVWQAGEADVGQWRMLPGTQQAQMISKAIAIRESKSLPSFIMLPWGNEPPKEAGK